MFEIIISIAIGFLFLAIVGLYQKVDQLDKVTHALVIGFQVITEHIIKEKENENNDTKDDTSETTEI